MEESEKNINLMLKIAPFVSTVSMIVYLICALALFDTVSYQRIMVSNFIFSVPIIVASFILVKCYFDHNKNTMKSLIGFILCGLVMLSMYYAFTSFDPTKWFFILKAVLFVLIVIFTVNQFLLSNDHYSRPVIVLVNQILIDLVCAIGLIGAIVDAVLYKDNPIGFIALLLFILSTTFIVFVLEMRVNDFKMKREEKGYVYVKSETTEEVLTQEDMFISNKLFNILPWFVLGGLVLSVIFNAKFDTAITWGYSIRYLFYVIKFVCLLLLILTYKAHNKNVMKVMSGFLLGFLLFENIFEATFISYSNFVKATSVAFMVRSIATLIMILINLFFVVAHLMLTRTHASNNEVVKAMKVVYVIYAILTVALAVTWSVCYIVAHETNFIFYAFKPFIWILGTFPVITGILTIDTRVNGFKVKREQK